MHPRLLSACAFVVLAGATLASAQPGSFITSNNSNLVFAASTLLTNGLPGLSGPPVTLMVFSVQSSSAQGGAVSLVGSQQWARRYNGPANNDDQAYDIVSDKDGNIIAAGYSTGIGTGTDFLTIKYTPEGVGLWTNRYDGDRIEAVAVDGSGGIYVCGEGANGIETIKYASDGTPVWTNTYSSSAMFYFFTGMAVDNSGNTYLAMVDSDTSSFITIKYDANGDPAWTNLFKSSPTSLESIYDVAVDTAGNIFVTGDSFDGTAGGSCLTIKYASDGSVLWTNNYSIEATGGSGVRAIVDQQENVIVAVDSHGIAGNRYAVIKYSNSGTMLWSNIVAAVNYAGGGVPAIAADPAGNVFLVGGTAGGGGAAADFTTIKYSSTGLPLWTNRFIDLNAGTYSFFGAATDNAGNLYWSLATASPSGANNNYVTVKYAAAGGAVWTNRYNGPANASDNPRAMTVDKAGGVYVTGTSSSGGTSFSALDWATVKYADNVRYVPPPGFVGQDTITFTALDSFGNSAPGTVVVNVFPGPLSTNVVAPDNYTIVAGNVGINTLIRGVGLPRTYQMQFTPDALSGLPTGARITGLNFRLATSVTVSFPETVVTWSDYEVRLAQAASPIANMSTNFLPNMLNPVLVKDGALTVSANNFSSGGNPKPFAAMVTLDTPYIYQGGDLVIHFTHSGSDSTNTTFLDGATSATPGYGTSYRAVSANAFGAANGTAASVTIVGIVFTPPITQAITRSGNQVIINGSGGTPGALYRVLSTTNAALPVAQWTPIVTNQVGAGGFFSYTNTIQPNTPARYFRVILP